jgi:hypothetical protein
MNSRILRLCVLLVALLSFGATSTFAQSWSNIVSSSRATTWNGEIGLPVTLLDGETTNVDGAGNRLPPTRAQCGSTIAAGTSLATVQSAFNACAAGTYLLLAAGSYTWTSGDLVLENPNVTLRGSGASATTINLAGASMQLGGASGAGSATIASFPSSTSFTMSSFSGLTLTAGNIVHLVQCNTGLSGSGCGTGTQTDNGGVFVCSDTSACAQQVSGGSTLSAQQQVVLVTSVTGSGPYTVNFSPALYMPNWSTANTATASWQSTSANAVGIGVEDIGFNITTSGIQAISLQNGYASWFKGVRFIGNDASACIHTSGHLRGLFVNNYFHYERPTAMDTGDGEALLTNNDSGMLYLNNITDTGDTGEYDGETGIVFAYNYSRDGNTAYIQNVWFGHTNAPSFDLMEGNEVGSLADDDTWASHTFNTFNRNFAMCADPPYNYPTNEGLARCFQVDPFSRGDNLVDNIMGWNTTLTPYYESTFSAPHAFGYEINFYILNPHDTLNQATTLLWNNCDVVNATCRTQTSENPTGLTGNAAVFNNLSSPATSSPCSFFMPGYTSTTCAAHPSGGTGLSFWKICTSWTTFPTACAATQTPPFPTFGHDVTGGAYVLGHGYDIPAKVADDHLPVDTSFQQSYSITGSTWSATCSGTTLGTYACETLTLSGLPTTTHMMGRFQISGGSCATSGAGTSTGAEVVMTASTSTTVSYQLASNPGTCTGTMLFPDVRQFDERVYQNDPVGVTLTPSPESFGAVNVGSSSSPIAFTLTNNTSTAATSISPSVSGGNSGDFAITNSGSGSCAAASGSIAASASCTFTVTFTPGAAGSRSTTLSVSYSGGDGASPQTSALSGTGNATGSVSLSPSSQNFGTITVGSASSGVTFTLSNTTGSGITGITVSFTGGNTGDFVNLGSGTCSSTLAASSSCTIIATFNPTAAGSRSTTLNVTDSASSSPQQSSLSGTGIVSVTAPAAAIFGILKPGPMPGQAPIPLLMTASARLSVLDQSVQPVQFLRESVTKALAGSLVSQWTQRHNLEK